MIFKIKIIILLGTIFFSNCATGYKNNNYYSLYRINCPYLEAAKKLTANLNNKKKYEYAFESAFIKGNSFFKSIKNIHSKDFLGKALMLLSIAKENKSPKGSNTKAYLDLSMKYSCFLDDKEKEIYYHQLIEVLYKRNNFMLLEKVLKKIKNQKFLFVKIGDFVVKQIKNDIKPSRCLINFIEKKQKIYKNKSFFSHCLNRIIKAYLEELKIDDAKLFFFMLESQEFKNYLDLFFAKAYLNINDMLNFYNYLNKTKDLLKKANLYIFLSEYFLNKNRPHLSQLYLKVASGMAKQNSYFKVNSDIQIKLLGQYLKIGKISDFFDTFPMLKKNSKFLLKAADFLFYKKQNKLSLSFLDMAINNKAYLKNIKLHYLITLMLLKHTEIKKCISHFNDIKLKDINYFNNCLPNFLLKLYRKKMYVQLFSHLKKIGAGHKIKVLINIAQNTENNFEINILEKKLLKDLIAVEQM